MAQGTIRTISRERGYGFIAVDGESATVYFYRDAVAGQAFDAFQEGQRVEFIITPDPLKTDRMRAEDIRLVE
jgi:CspA family cold shock protein